MWNSGLFNNNHPNTLKRGLHSVPIVLTMGTGLMAISPMKKFENPNYINKFTPPSMVQNYSISASQKQKNLEMENNHNPSNNNNNITINIPHKNNKSRRKRRNRKRNRENKSNKQMEVGASTMVVEPTNLVGTPPSCFNLSSEFCPLLKDIDRETCEKQRRISTTSEDSFIIFFDENEVDEGVCSSSGNDSDAETVPRKRVRFADDSELCEIHPMVQWSFAYQQARKGPWLECARDRERFQLRIHRTGKILEAVLTPEHRQNIYEERFKEDK